MIMVIIEDLFVPDIVLRLHTHTHTHVWAHRYAHTNYILSCLKLVTAYAVLIVLMA